MNNIDLYLEQLIEQKRIAVLKVDILRRVLDNWNPSDVADIVLKIELSGQLEVAKATERSIDKQIFDIRKNMA